MKKRVIGCIVDNVEGGYNRVLWNNIRNAAKNVDCSLRVFEGRHLRDTGYDGRHNAIYELAKKYRPDGWLVVGSQIVSYVTMEEYAAFCSRFGQSIPMVSLGVDLPGTASVLLDNGQGIKRLLEHLIRTHGYRRIAFIKGPEGNFEAIERHRVYLSIMAAHRIEVDPNLVFKGSFSRAGGYDAYRKLYESGLACDCIVCANDDTAFGAYFFVRELLRKGIRPPTEHITGFDNSKNAQIQRPSLTTVAQPLDKMIERAFRILLGALPGEHPQERVVFPTELVVRESCGCQYMSETSELDDLYVQLPYNERIHQTTQTYSLPDLFSELARILPSCGIRACFIVRYVQPDGSTGPWHVPEESDLLFAYTDERRYPQAENVRFPTAELLPDLFPSHAKCVIDLIKPLFFRDEQYGYIILEAVDDDTRNFEALRGQIADSLKFALMIKRQKESEAHMDDMIAQLRDANLLLTESAIRDPLTGLLSRNGLFEAGGQHLGDRSCDGEVDLLVYVDIDRLKEINLMHGYPEGDSLIRATADILSRACPDDAILSRFCGDEFAILVKKASEEHFDALRSRICGFVEQYRQASRSQLEVYIGHTVFTHGSDVSLENVIRQADIDLYARKRSETQV